MAIEAIVTDKAPAALGPYSAAVAAPATKAVHVSGQLPIDPATGEFAGEDIQAQTRQSLTNIKNILEAAGASMADVAEVTVLLDDIADFAAMNEVYGEFFTGVLHRAVPQPRRLRGGRAAQGRQGRDQGRGLPVGRASPGRGARRLPRRTALRGRSCLGSRRASAVLVTRCREERRLGKVCASPELTFFSAVCCSWGYVKSNGAHTVAN